MALKELSIRNFAIIKQLEIEINDGLTVVTGETGAGKSILLGALNLLLGARADIDMIRHGEDKCEISALFDISKLSNVTRWLEQRDLSGGEDEALIRHCLIRRVVRANKPTKCYINDRPTTLASLKEIGQLLVDLHGQHEHQSLLRRPSQRRIVDQFANHQADLDDLAKLAAQIHQLERELKAVTEGNSDKADRMKLMSFQLNELDEANIAPDEYSGLQQAMGLLSNSQQLIEGIELAEDQLFHNESSNVTTVLGKQIYLLTELAENDKSLNQSTDLLNSALAQIEEAQGSLSASLARIEKDPERLQEVSQRLDTLINLARKHRCPEDLLNDRHQTLREEYERLENEYLQPEKLQVQLKSLRDQYFNVALTVSKKRKNVAHNLSNKITEQMQGLGMQGGRIEIQVEDNSELISEHGIDAINYLVSTNQGMPLKPLQKTASGGELSRISLAIQVITSEQSSTPSLVFDEVDVGVGGKVAGIVGNKLAKLGEHAQVLCITHLPQVACKGDHHLAVDKVSSANETYTTLVNLQGEQRTEEIARMLGGTEITESVRATAREMLIRSDTNIQAASSVLAYF
ncbi:MAG: DNA repair protein RecN (Recombination protein N) [Arenicella sp.]|jgi:DNA repair protein RecN (Recombination protein N)